MRALIAIVAALMLTGCTSILQRAGDVIPTLAFCSDVEYVRHGEDIDVKLKCKRPR